MASGKNYSAKLEKYNGKQATKAKEGVKPFDISQALNKARKEIGYSKKPKVKGQKKKASLVSGQKNEKY